MRFSAPRRIARGISAAAGLCLLLLGPVVLVGDDADSPEAAAKARFDKLKTLVGEWSGKASHGGPASNATVLYRLTAGGSALQETLFAGTGHEMVTMYHRHGADLILTHYCAAGNQPRMKFEPGPDADKFTFRFLDGTNLQADKDFHMHEGTLELVDADHLKAEWVSYKDGKAVGAAKFDLQRVKSKPNAKPADKPH